jgi:hypothetical protein
MSMAIGGVIVGGAVINGLVQNSASKRAANAQLAAADKASDTALEQYYQTREDQQPWRNAGTFALSQLVGSMGGNPSQVTGAASGIPGGTIGPLNAGATDGGLGRRATSATVAPTTGNLTRSFSLADLARDPQYAATVGGTPRDFSKGFTSQQLAQDPIYASSGARSVAPFSANSDPEFQRLAGNRDFSQGFTTQALDRDAAYQRLVGGKDYTKGFTTADLKSDPAYAAMVGSRDFSKGFTGADLQSDPSYRWRLQQGQQALERSAAARGGALSGGSLKDLTDYAQGAASQEYQNAYGRFSNDRALAANLAENAASRWDNSRQFAGTMAQAAADRFANDRAVSSAEYQNAYGRYNADRGFAADQATNAYNRWTGERANAQAAYQDAYNRYNNDTTQRFNRLSSLAGIGQQANNTVASLGAQTAAQVGQNQLAAGNARAAGYVGTANAVNNGMSSLQSMYFMNKYLGGGGASSSPAGGGYTPTSMYGGDTGMTGGFDNLPMYA